MKMETVETSQSKQIHMPSRDEETVNLEMLIAKLKGICHEIDPYSELTLSMKERLVDIGIEEFNDPFALTNNLLFMTENAIEKLTNLKEEL
jgi:hypothetical protein